MTNLCLVSCKTQAGEPCWFPFYYNNKEHYECITDDNDGTGNCMPDPGKMCSLFSVIRIMTNLCLVQCKTEQNHTCILPFNYKGTIYYQCTTKFMSGKWCPYEDLRQQSGERKWDICEEEC